MPELPEVETIKNDLLNYIDTNQIIKSAKIHDPEFFKKHSNITDLKIIENQKLHKIERYGKVLFFKLDKGYLGFHLGMSGQIVNDLKNTKYPQHVRFSFSVNNNYVYFIDVRKFGWIKYVEDINTILPKGIDPLIKEFTFDYFSQKCIKNSRPIKTILLDQKYIAGIGNIYACEMLFCAGISPNTSGNNLSGNCRKELYFHVKEVLKDGIKNYGTTFSMYQNMSGEKGQQQNYLYVYGREGDDCKKCGSVIKRDVIAGRSTFYCPKCQK